MPDTATSLDDDQGVKPDLPLDVDVKEAERLKLEGNNYFRLQRWEEALVAYKTALGYLPKRRPEKTPERKEPDENAAAGTNELEELSSFDAESSGATPSPDSESVKARSILNANIGACHVKLGEHKEAVAACTDAILDDPRYMKALQRRAASNEAIGSWSALTSAQEDYNTLVSILPPSSSQIAEIKRSLQSLKPRIDIAQKREMDDMVGKLKDLGNSFLGNFGLSTNNFKFEPNGQGGYSMNFAQ